MKPFYRLTTLAVSAALPLSDGRVEVGVEWRVYLPLLVKAQ